MAKRQPNRSMKQKWADGPGTQVILAKWRTQRTATNCWGAPFHLARPAMFALARKAVALEKTVKAVIPKLAPDSKGHLWLLVYTRFYAPVCVICAGVFAIPLFQKDNCCVQSNDSVAPKKQMIYMENAWMHMEGCILRTDILEISRSLWTPVKQHNHI